MWRRRACANAGGWRVTVGSGRRWFPCSVHLCGSANTEVECTRMEHRRSLITVFGLPISLGQLVVWRSPHGARSSDLLAHCPRYGFPACSSHVCDSDPLHVLNSSNPCVALEGAASERCGLRDVVLRGHVGCGKCASNQAHGGFVHGSLRQRLLHRLLSDDCGLHGFALPCHLLCLHLPFSAGWPERAAHTQLDQIAITRCRVHEVDVYCLRPGEHEW
mmetsp:Transcript_7844/g.14220  ORF Transcript_7844/g.14220 Transcript_7844/m.14220 type:complete len:218 (-) Transcript_7844:473-1126(-)